MNWHVLILILASQLISIKAFYQIELNMGLLTTTLGYTATIYIGSPPQKLQVQIDTGSTKLAVRCTTCPKCFQPHKNQKYDPSLSKQSEKLTCKEGYFCSNCQKNESLSNWCLLEKKYVDDSYIRGTMYKDNNNASIQQGFGCIEEESQTFRNDTNSDGIWGVGRKYYHNPQGQFVRTDTFFEQISKRFGLRQRVLGFCLAREGGFMTLGGINKTLVNKDYSVSFPYNDNHHQLVSKSLGLMKIGNTTIHKDAGSLMPNLIIDTGSSSSLLHKLILDPILQYLTQTCQSHSSICKIFKSDNDTCFSLQNHQQLSIFSPIELYFAGQKVIWRPDQFIFDQKQGKSDYCLLMESSQTFYILGQDFMLNKYVIYYDSNVTIYPQSNCSHKLHKIPSNFNTYNKGESKSYIALVVIGVILVIVVAIIVGYCLHKKFTKKMDQSYDQDIQFDLDEPIPSNVRFRNENEIIKQ